MKYPYRDPDTGRFGRAIVRHLPKLADFCVVDHEVQTIKDNIGVKAHGYKSFFVIIGDGDYDAVWGMVGTVPNNHKQVYRII